MVSSQVELYQIISPYIRVKDVNLCFQARVYLATVTILETVFDMIYLSYLYYMNIICDWYRFDDVSVAVM